MKQSRWNAVIAWVTSTILVGLWIYSLSVDNHYKWDFFFLMGLLWGLFFIRNKIALHPLHFGLFSIFLLLHDFGMFGAYNLYPLGIEYDFYVHGFFGFVAALILYRAYTSVGYYKGWFMIVAIVAVVLGFSAFHELFEFGAALVLGEGEGVLFVGAGDLDPWDTQKDMLNNLIGGLIALGLYGLKNSFMRRTRC